MNTFGGQAGSAHVAAQEDEVRSHSNAEMTYHGGRFRLEPGQALVVTVHEPDKPFLYWGLTLTSPWMESFDYRYATTALNNKTATRSADGSWRMVIAPTRPGGGELARHRGAARGLHARALGAGRRSAAPDGRGGRQTRVRCYGRAPQRSDLGRDPEALLVGRHQGPVGRQVEPGVGEGVVVPAGAAGVAGGQVRLQGGAELLG